MNSLQGSVLSTTHELLSYNYIQSGDKVYHTCRTRLYKNVQYYLSFFAIGLHFTCNIELRHRPTVSLVLANRRCCDKLMRNAANF